MWIETFLNRIYDTFSGPSECLQIILIIIISQLLKGRTPKDRLMMVSETRTFFSNGALYDWRWKWALKRTKHYLEDVVFLCLFLKIEEDKKKPRQL